MLQMSANIAGNAVKLRIASSFPEVERIWRDFETRALMTPYQQYGWLEPWFRHVGTEEQVEPLIVCGEANGRLVFLWPFGLQRIHGLLVCRWLGGKQCNYNLGLFDREVLPMFDGADIREFLTIVSELAGGIDVFELLNQPQSWNGVANPFADIQHQASPNPCYRMELASDFDTLEKQRRNARSIQGVRRKSRKLSKSHGEVRLTSPSGKAELETVFQECMAQRAHRFGEMGVTNIFARDGFFNFLREVSHTNRPDGDPVLAFHALFAGDKVCATYAGLEQNGHYSCFINSVDLVAFGKFSPGDIILSRLIEESCHKGLSCIDLGMGQSVTNCPGVKRIHCLIVLFQLRFLGNCGR